MQTTSDYADVTEPGVVRIERVLPGPVERIWAYLTEADKRGQWFAGGEMEQRAGGSASFVFRNSQLTRNDDPAPEKYRKHAGEITMQSTITECDKPRVLAFTFGNDPEASAVRFDLTPRGKDVLLTVTHRRIATRDGKLSISAGWHAHIGILIALLDGREPDGFWRSHTRLEWEYDRLIPAGPVAGRSASEMRAQP